MSRILVLILFILVVVGGGLGLGYLFQPGPWYAALEKPVFTPPDEVFRYVWPVLYVLIAFAGWRIFTDGITGGPWGWWLIALVLNFLYVPFAFGENLLGWSTIVVFAALVAAIAFIRSSWYRDRLAGALFVPYALWLGYAFTLSITLWWNNGAPLGAGPVEST